MSVLLVADSRWGGAPRDAAHALEPRSLLHGEALGAALLSDWATERLGELLATLELWMPRVQEGPAVTLTITLAVALALALALTLTLTLTLTRT